MTMTGGPVAGQLDLFGAAVPDAVPESVLMALHAEYYDLIWQGAKTHEFRRRFLEGRSVRWFVYLDAPVSRLAAVIDLGPAVVGSPDEVAGIAELMRPGNGASVLEYVRDLDRAFAIPILGVTEYPGLSADELRAELGAFHPPQGYVRLAQHAELMAVCEKVSAEAPVRSITVHHRLYRFRCGRQRPALKVVAAGAWSSLASNSAGLPTATGEEGTELDAGADGRGDRPADTRRAFRGHAEHAVRLGAGPARDEHQPPGDAVRDLRAAARSAVRAPRRATGLRPGGPGAAGRVGRAAVSDARHGRGGP
jgi:predicted transcriptional regulator